MNVVIAVVQKNLPDRSVVELCLSHIRGMEESRAVTTSFSTNSQLGLSRRSSAVPAAGRRVLCKVRNN